MGSDTLLVAKTLLAEATGQSVQEIPDNASIHTMPAWDSLVHMRVILALETKIGHELDPEAVMEITSLEDLASCLE
jgi:acyl carrier protein